MCWTESIVGGPRVIRVKKEALSFSDTNPVSALIVLFIWGALGSLAFITQQRRLRGLAPEHANVILAPITQHSIWVLPEGQLSVALRCNLLQSMRSGGSAQHLWRWHC
ncbi:hypothetical protein [Dictyobacter arantiisoli]|uniref:Uncharacterized protein n=1 Tax=Dictyobacter arantiisoli TaxID=2014874 RepID=A0A5A5T6V2_9CHLR|nr:hypothetical protein [Dictyobacter arantiisoli]GCF07132.1 hypothetical protein KDI_06960 [Dictyobacter arantiisoli]